MRMTWQFDVHVDTHFCAQYGTRKSHISKTAVHNLSWLCSPIRGFGSDFHFHSWLCNSRESLPNHCCRWLSGELNQWLKVLYSSSASASVIKILSCCVSVMEILLRCSKPKCERFTLYVISIICVAQCKLTALFWLNQQLRSCCLSLNHIYICKIPIRMFWHTEITIHDYHTLEGL